MFAVTILKSERRAIITNANKILSGIANSVDLDQTAHSKSMIWAAMFALTFLSESLRILLYNRPPLRVFGQILQISVDPDQSWQYLLFCLYLLEALLLIY